MHVKRTTRRRGEKEYTYLSLVESVRINGKKTHQTLLRLGEIGELERSGQLDRIVAALSGYTTKHFVAAEGLEGEGAPSFGATAAISAYFDRLGLREHFRAIGDRRHSKNLADTIFVMVANRLCDPSSKRRTIHEWLATVALPEGVVSPLLDQCYRGIDAIADEKEATEELLYARLTDLTNLDLRLALYDLTSTYFETSRGPVDEFSSRAYGYSRDHRPDRPQVVIGLLVTGNGIPIAHYVFPGNTRDSTTLPQVMADYQSRFGVGKIALVADRGLISEKNLQDVAAAGFDHVLATRLHHDGDVAAVLERAAAAGDDAWRAVPGFPGTKAFEVNLGGRRFVVVSSAERKARDDRRREELLARVESKLITLADRVRAGKLVDPAKIGAAADRILRDSGVGRCFAVTIRHGVFSWRFDEEALAYDEKLLAGRYVLTTSLQAREASVTDIVRHYKMLQNVERRFRVMKDFLGLRPVHHHKEERVRGHIALCVIAAVIEAVMGNDLQHAGVKDPDIADQTISPRRALAELGTIRLHKLNAGRHIELVDRPTTLQRQILDAWRIEADAWSRARIS
ncbi:MAG: IS1634 family transposase [Acidimicrobiales bacterium]